MRFRNMENRLAALAAVIVLIGVSTAAGNALANENPAAGLEVQPDGTTYERIGGEN